METTERGWSILTITISLIPCYINRKEVNPVVCSRGIPFYLLWDYFLIFQFTLEYRLQTFHFSSFFLLPFITHIFLCPFENMIAFFSFIRVLVHVCTRIYGLESLLSLFTIWVLGIKLGSPCCGDVSFLLRHLSDPPVPSY